jgi:hypothetical protein
MEVMIMDNAQLLTIFTAVIQFMFISMAGWLVVRVYRLTLYVAGDKQWRKFIDDSRVDHEERIRKLERKSK